MPYSLTHQVDDTASVTLTASQRKGIIAACIGNFTEWYEFVLYGYFAATLAQLFFPADSAAASLMLTFAVFGVSFLVRPLGGLIFGYIGDRYGRRITLSIIIILISAATALMAVVPGYASIGIAAPVLILLLRFAQGLSAGGEWMGAAAYVIETAPSGRRAYYGSWQTVTIILRMMSAALASLVTNRLLSPEAVLAWGWRIPFLLSLPLGLFGLYLRLKLDESIEYQEMAKENAKESAPLRATLQHDWRSILQVASLVSSTTMCTYVLLVYGPTFMITQLGISPVQARLAGFGSMGVLMVATVLFAILSDRIGRRPLLIGGALWVIFSAYFGFYLLHQQGLGYWVAGLSIVIIGQAMMLGPQPAVFSELFPTSRRYSGLAIGYNIGVVLFGGAGPFVASALISLMQSTYAPALYLVIGGLISLVGACTVPETRDRNLRGD
jgi:MHS family proline/betaine transporter-like MFS transporter